MAGIMLTGAGLSDKCHGETTPGTLKWSYTTGCDIYSSPAIASDGTIYVGSLWDGKLYAIASSSSGPADSPWPMGGHDQKHTGRK